MHHSLWLMRVLARPGTTQGMNRQSGVMRCWPRRGPGEPLNRGSPSL